MRETSEFIAGLIGPVMIATGATVLFNRDELHIMAVSLAGHWGVVFIMGLISLVAGLAIVRVHNVWSGGWPVLVTVIGWYAVASGIGRMVYAPQLAGLAATIAGNAPLAVGIAFALLVTGAFLTLKGYRLLD